MVRMHARLDTGVQCRLHLRDVAVSMYDMTEWH